MLCDNCGKREANVRYSENINGRKKELNLCEECSKKLGITDQMNFHMGLDFPSLFGGIFEDFADFAEPSFTPLLNEIRDVMQAQNVTIANAIEYLNQVKNYEIKYDVEILTLEGCEKKHRK